MCLVNHRKIQVTTNSQTEYYWVDYHQTQNIVLFMDEGSMNVCLFAKKKKVYESMRMYIVQWVHLLIHPGR